jgi:tRNA dimethylallyltransferase
LCQKLERQSAIHNPKSKIKVPVLLGPTGVGKTDLALELAERAGAEIIACDSRQVYRFLDIGTAKPTNEERKRVKHHLIDVVAPDEDYNAGRYAREALNIIRRLSIKGKPFLVVAGTGLYLRALVRGIFDAPDIPREIRERIVAEAGTLGQRAMHERLEKVDPEAAGRIHSHDPQRTLRALEVYEATGKPLSEWWRDSKAVRKELEPLLLGLTRPREVLYERINQRVERMMEQGLIRECEGLLKKGYSPRLNALRTVGYQETFEHLEGERGLPETVSLIQKNTRNYAKRQMTWFRKEPDVEWLDAEELSRKELVERLRERLLTARENISRFPVLYSP